MSDATVHWMNRSWDYVLNGPEKKEAPTQKEHQNFISERNPNLAKRATPAQTFSLGGAIVFALGWLFSLKSDNSLVKWTTGILTAVGLGATALFKGWNKDGNDSIFSSIKKFFSVEEQEKHCKEKIFEQVAKYLSQKTGGTEEEIKNALLKPTSENSALLKNVLQIEYIAKKKDSLKYDIEIHVYIPGNEKDKVVKGTIINSDESSDELLPKIREAFLQEGGDTHSCVLYPNNQKS